MGNDDESDALNRLAEGAFSTLGEHIRNAADCDFIQSYRTGDQISILVSVAAPPAPGCSRRTWSHAAS
ncbi:MAG: hypothetical protein H7343_18120 [Undibacterium sp.]|nr:hypothetical protein [Opitutaceae bacterium]